MDSRIKTALYCLSVFSIPVLSFFTGGASSPLRFLYFPLMVFLSQQLTANLLFLIGVTYVFLFSLLPLNRGNVFTPVFLVELSACLFTALIAGLVSRSQQKTREKYDNAVSTFHSLSDDLHHKNMNLQTTLDALTSANRKLQEYDRKKTNFLSNVSHELRTPLSSIRSYSEILLNYDDIDNDTCKEFIQIINMESERLSNLVNEVLDLMKIESGKIELSISNLRPAMLLEESEKIIKPMLLDKGLVLRLLPCDGLPEIFGDKNQIIQVLVNLLNNAVKFTQAGAITLGAQLKDDFVEFSVNDTGEGIFPEERDKIFDEFFRISEAAEGRPEGSGLGLSISKKIVEFHGGRIWVDSEPGRGSTFYFTIPLASSNARSAVDETFSIKDANIRECRPILVMASDLSVRRTLRMKLESLGYNTLGGDTQERAKQIIRDMQPGIVVLDMSENSDDYSDFFYWAKTNAIKVILVSLYQWNHGDEPSLTLHGYISRPFDKYQIISMFEALNIHRGELAIFSPLQDESRNLQVLLSSSVYSVKIFSDAALAVQACINAPPKGIIIGAYDKSRTEEIIMGLKSNARTRNIPLFLVLRSSIHSHVKAVTLDRENSNPGIYKLIGEIETTYLKSLEM